ncbi:hypothetical protein [Pandoraea sp. CB10b_02]|nr:hypothetical protein [Pandoraea sp. CB10b_02]
MKATARTAITAALIASILAFLAWREAESWRACRAVHPMTYCLTTWEN